MRKRGFTLIEIMVSVSIIIMLAGMVATASMFVNQLVQKHATKAVISKLRLAIVSYATDYEGRYPLPYQTTEAFYSSPTTYDALESSGDKASIQALCSYIFGNPYFMQRPGKPHTYANQKDFKGKMTVTKEITLSGDKYIVVDYVIDSWDNPLFYYAPGALTRNSDSFDIFSAGPDTKSSTFVFRREGSKYKKEKVFDYQDFRPRIKKTDALGRTYLDELTEEIGRPSKIPGYSNPIIFQIETADEDDAFEYILDDIGNF